MKKVTLATFKSFVKKNSDRLYIQTHSKFDGMVDCVMPVEDSFKPAYVNPADVNANDAWYRRTLGINGVWIVGESRDCFAEFEKNGYRGIEVYNACGCFSIAVKI